MLYHLTQNSEALLLLTGVKGSGKTSLLEKFIAMGNDTWRYCLIRANTMMNPEHMLRHIAEGFGLDPDRINFNSALETLKNRFIELRRSGLTAMLLIDNAHELPAASLTVLMKLSELRDDEEGLIRIILFSEPQIRDMLSAPELADVRHRITHTLEMPTLNEQQTMDYINYRLSVAGLGVKSPLSRGKMKKIHRLSHGIPALINEHANALLHGGESPADASAATGTAVLTRLKASMAIVVMLCVAGLLTYFVMGNAFKGLFGNGSPQTVAQLDLPKLKKPVDATPVVPLTAEPEAASPEIITEKLETPPLTDNNTTPVVPPAADEPIINQYAWDKDIEDNNTSEPVTEKPVAEKPVEKNTTPAAPRPVVTPVLRTDKKTSPAPAKPVSTKPAPRTVAEDWLTQQNKNYFTLQLTGSHSRDSVDAFRRKHKLSGQVAIVKTLHQGNEWYVLVYGSYSSKDKARAAIPKLPASLRESSPWPRRIGDLKP
jgi:DamX protein